MTTIDVEASYNELLTLFKESMYTRIPVYEDDSDNIIGIINVKDFLLVSNKRMFKIRDIMREAYYTCLLYTSWNHWTHSLPTLHNQSGIFHGNCYVPSESASSPSHVPHQTGPCSYGRTGYNPYILRSVI